MSAKKVLVCSVPCWNSKSGSDTFSTLMAGYDIEKIANLYIREDFPDSKVCNNYFRISENAVIKSILKRKIKTGKQIVTTGAEKDDNTQNAAVTEQRYRKQTAKRNYLLLFAREILWALGRWKTPELDKFIEDFNPDVVFFAMEGYIHFNRINRYILKKTGAKGIGYFWDDNFTYRQSKNIWHNLYRFFQRSDLKKTAKMCDSFFAISPKTKKEADEFFGIECEILTKPIDFENAEFCASKVSEPIKMLYTGKLVIGRFDTIKLIGKALDEINKQGVKIELDVYTTTYLSEADLAELSEHVHILGAIPQTEVAKVQSAADVLLFAEAVDGENAKTARLSFSTKLTDYFRSGKCILAVGNADTAPMEYLADNQAALVADDFESIYSELKKIIDDSDLISKYAKKAYECGRKNHDKQQIQKILFETLNN